MQRSFYEVDSVEAPWNTGNDVEEDGTPNIGFKNRVKRGYFPVPPSDNYQDLRDEMVASCRRSVWFWSAPTTRWRVPASRRSTTASRRCSTPPTI